jgi:hypothetical protein
MQISHPLRPAGIRDTHGNRAPVAHAAGDRMRDVADAEDTDAAPAGPALQHQMIWAEQLQPIQIHTPGHGSRQRGDGVHAGQIIGRWSVWDGRLDSAGQ